MTFEVDDRVFETSITTGTGTYTLDGAQVGFTTFVGMGNGNDCPYFATDDTNWEVGVGNILTSPNRLVRTTILRSSNADAAVDWGAGTRKIRCGWLAAMALPRVLTKSVAGNVNVALTTDEQRRDIIILTGALTGAINVTVDATPWKWTVYNNTTGAYSLTVKTTAGTGIAVAQGTTMSLYCDETNVVAAATGFANITASGTLVVTGTITPGQTTGIVGTKTNNNPQAGSIGEYVESLVDSAASVALGATGVTEDITTISLTAGDWDVSILGGYDVGSVTTQMLFWIGTTAGNSAAEMLSERRYVKISGLTGGGSDSGAIPSFRMSLAATTTVRFKSRAAWSGTAPNVFGRISARRVR